MKIYEELIPREEFSQFIKHPKGIFLFLSGINISKNSIEPLYKVHIWTAPGILFVELPGLLIVFMQKYPWIWIEKKTGGDDESFV